jgi:hypothetical protein
MQQVLSTLEYLLSAFAGVVATEGSVEPSTGCSSVSAGGV